MSSSARTAGVLRTHSHSKRKHPSLTQKSIKSARTRLPQDQFQWRSVNTAHFAGMDEGGGMMMLEELDDVDIQWDEDDGGRKTARFIAAEDGKRNIRENNLDGTASEEQRDLNAQEALPSFSNLEAEDLNELDDSVEIEAAFDESLLPDWRMINLHSTLKQALLALGLVKPTDIQLRSLPHGLAGRDVVGVAETGSGKTLAYSLPILSHLLRAPRPPPDARRTLSALMLCPTRELALQVMEHLQRVVRATITEDSEVSIRKRPPRISIGSIVGGLSAQKQKRIVERGCDVLVATPGRLWDLIKADEVLASGIRGLRFLIVDEADRMIETGHFAELENIVRLTQRATDQTASPDDDDPIFASTGHQDEDAARDDLQTFIFSATLSKDLQHNLKRKKRGHAKRGMKQATALEDLVEKLDFRDPNPEVIDLSPEGGVVRMLKESMVECVAADKDLYLYYFLLRYSGRSLVFVGSIDGIRRLLPLFELLQIPVYPLHSQLQQKQRLKNLDRFKASRNGVLIATDVAARGLDIPQVDHVVHFNLPRTADKYVHRSGRTARAQNPGFALQLCSAEEKGSQRALMKSLNRNQDLPELPIENGFLPKLKERIQLARDIEKAQHRVKKDAHDRHWLREAAEAMDVDIDPSMLSDGNDDPHASSHRPQSKPNSKTNKGVGTLRAQLQNLLAEPLMARGVSAKYPTSGSKVIIDDLINSTGHATMLGSNTTKAYDETHARRKSFCRQEKTTGSQGNLV